MNSIKHFFTQLFTELNAGDSWTILGMLLSTFLIGLITNYFLNRRRVRQLEESLEQSAKDKAQIKAQFDGLQQEHALQEADLAKTNLALVDKSKNLEIADAEKRTLNSRLNATLLDLDKSREEFLETSSRMEDLNDQILGLRTKNAQLNTELEQGANATIQYGINQNSTVVEQEQKITDLTAENSLLKNSIEELRTSGVPDGTTAATLRITELEAENQALKNKVKAGDSDTSLTALMEENERLKEQLEELPQYEAGNEVLNHSMQTLISENEDLQNHADNLIQYEAGNEVLHTTLANLIEKNEALEKELNEARSTQIEWAVGDNLEEEELEELDAEEAKLKIKAAIGNQIARAIATERDDLKQIIGIGPFIEEKLNDLGIYTFEQVSQLDNELTETLTAAIEFFPGRIDRDDWVGQADRLNYTKSSTTPPEMANISKITTRSYATATEKIIVADADVVANTVAIKSVVPDDLKEVEGIGPKIAQILNEGGILTFADLAATPVNQLTDILAEAGNRYKMHNPATWPEQAKLAAAGEWTKLKDWQDHLDGGRDVAKG